MAVEVGVTMVEVSLAPRCGMWLEELRGGVVVAGVRRVAHRREAKGRVMEETVGLGGRVDVALKAGRDVQRDGVRL